MTARKKTPEQELKSIQESLTFLHGFAQGVDRRIEALEKRLKVLEERVTQPVGGLKR